ncbi:MAG TPA: hypothetical protein ENK38_02090 [Gammaproteobacteria bacterium]|nr:hypothetical protein [Gammaproteobacteria bacterium]
MAVKKKAAKKHTLRKKQAHRKPPTAVTPNDQGRSTPAKKKAAKKKVSKKKVVAKKRAKPRVNGNQQRLLDQLLLTPKIKEAAGIIGMPYDTAKRICTKSHFIDALEAAREKVSEKVQKKAAVDPAYVLRQSVKLHERCMQEVQPVLARGSDGKMEPTGEYKFEHTGAAKALELIGKHKDVQAFKENVGLDVNVKTGMDKFFESMSGSTGKLPGDE